MLAHLLSELPHVSTFLIIYTCIKFSSMPRSDYSNVFTVGADHGHSFYNSKRHRKETERVGHIYYADLKSQALYFQNTTLFNEASLSISFGARYEITDFGGNNTVDRNVLGFVNAWDSTELAIYSKQTSNDAFNLGFEKEISTWFVNGTRRL